MCNGTRLICRSFNKNIIHDAEIAIGDHAEKRVFLPQIPLSPLNDNGYPFKLKNKQILIEYIFLKSAFYHGQLYVTLSIGISIKTTKIWIKLIGDNRLPSNCTKKKLFIKNHFLIYASLTFKFLYFNLIINFFNVHIILLHFKLHTFKFNIT